jgi:hypothetical protein
MEDTTKRLDVISDAINILSDDNALAAPAAMAAAAIVDLGMRQVAGGGNVAETTITIDGAQMGIAEAFQFLAKKATDSEVKPPEKFDITKPRIIKEVPIILDKERHLRLPFWALKKFQAETGVNPWDHSRVWSYPPDMDALVALIWCGLLDEDPDLTLEQVERMPNMDFGNIHYLRYCLDECWGENQPKPDALGSVGERATDPNPRPQAPIGSTIGPLRGMTSDSPTESSGPSLPGSTDR